MPGLRPNWCPLKNFDLFRNATCFFLMTFSMTLDNVESNEMGRKQLQLNLDPFLKIGILLVSLNASRKITVEKLKFTN